MIELTEEQRRELKSNGEHARLFDSTTNMEYVLVPADVYARLRALEEAESEAEQSAWSDVIEEARSDMANE